jgi:hypothetical protein
MLMDRQNVTQGVTEIESSDGKELGRFVLATAGEAALLDDRRIRRGVTIAAIDPTGPANRDALVVAFAAAPAAGERAGAPGISSGARP